LPGLSDGALGRLSGADAKRRRRHRRRRAHPAGPRRRSRARADLGGPRLQRAGSGAPGGALLSGRSGPDRFPRGADSLLLQDRGGRRAGSRPAAPPEDLGRHRGCPTLAGSPLGPDAAMRTVALAAGAAGGAASGNAAVTAFEWSLYQRLSARQPAGRPAIVIIRDAAGESTRGPGVRDRAMLARLVTSLSQAGAAVIGLDASLEQPSAPGRGGAASDALLSQAIALAENVVLPI